ncbi:hypothetical protein QFW80_16805 [Luteimonas sp. M1R5S18]|uniref:Concanavalin A-like lectin/glucanase superfamily protein n=1 Tax=Luteimonas rhizosphaericola TaxID=3042024 RepID=A0ABT6JNC2_9GAMM|nr:hypothetical protein [Luteimonas rhizosphaericola]MDH5832180.1 hypothetical protein [Luteimonas rhizosphaericola]
MSLLAHQARLMGSTSGAFREVLLSMSPLLYLPMDEAEGSVAHALAGADGTYLGSPTLGRPPILPGDAGTSIGTANNANRVRATRVLTGGGEFTCCIALRTSHTGSQMLILDQDVGAGSTPRHFLAINRSSSTTAVGVHGSVCSFGHNPPSNSNQHAYALGAGLTDGAPHLLVWGRNALGSPFVDVDGVAQTMTGNTLQGTIWGGTYWGIGQSPLYAAGLYVGDLAHFACWQRTLSPEERAELAVASGLAA